MHKHFAASFLRCPYSWLEDVFRKNASFELQDRTEFEFL